MAVVSAVRGGDVAAVEGDEDEDDVAIPFIFVGIPFIFDYNICLGDAVMRKMRVQAGVSKKYREPLAFLHFYLSTYVVVP
mmetsp:Transcript_11165/g.23752  ORF Transcript_11165/g.23752 Transcript_11165/m.23752 type:complete len:80 (-) Transcript_11165:246-485(-)